MATELSQDLKTTAHYLVSEASGYRSREQVLIASGSDVLKAGAVLGKVTASGKYAPFAPASEDGTENAAAILFEGCDAAAADVRRTITARDSEVHVDVLEWTDGVNDAQKNAALTALAALGIIGR
jgi:hypothetical protein